MPTLKIILAHVYLRAYFQARIRAIWDGDYKYKKDSNFEGKEESVLTLDH